MPCVVQASFEQYTGMRLKLQELVELHKMLYLKAVMSKTNFAIRLDTSSATVFSARIYFNYDRLNLFYNLFFTFFLLPSV